MTEQLETNVFLLSLWFSIVFVDACRHTKYPTWYSKMQRHLECWLHNQSKGRDIGYFCECRIFLWWSWWWCTNSLVCYFRSKYIQSHWPMQKRGLRELRGNLRKRQLTCKLWISFCGRLGTVNDREGNFPAGCRILFFSGLVQSSVVITRPNLSWYFNGIGITAT